MSYPIKIVNGSLYRSKSVWIVSLYIYDDQGYNMRRIETLTDKGWESHEISHPRYETIYVVPNKDAGVRKIIEFISEIYLDRTVYLPKRDLSVISFKEIITLEQLAQLLGYDNNGTEPTVDRPFSWSCVEREIPSSDEKIDS
jgi:hypothetical protein